MAQPVEDYDESYAEDDAGGRSKIWILWVVLGVILAALLVGGVLLYRAGAFDWVLSSNRQPTPSQTPAQTVTTPVNTLPVTPPGSWSSDGGYRDPSGKVTGTASVIPDDLQTGDCIYNFTGAGSAVNTLVVVPCTSPHEAEVYATQTQVANDTAAIQQFCMDQFASYIGVPFNSSSLSATFVHDQAAQPMTNVQCVVYSAGVTVTESYKGSKK